MSIIQENDELKSEVAEMRHFKEALKSTGMMAEVIDELVVFLEALGGKALGRPSST